MFSAHARPRIGRVAWRGFQFTGLTYRWTFTGTSAETGTSVRVPGYEEWTIASNGLIAESRGHFDQTEYDRQLQQGIDPAI